MNDQYLNSQSYQQYQPSMKLSKDQQLALAKIAYWYDKGIYVKEPFTLTGGAGTGKSTLMPEVVNMLNIKEYKILIITSSEFIGRKMQTRFPNARYRTIASLTKTYATGYDINISALNKSNNVFMCNDLTELKKNLMFIFKHQPKVAKKFPFKSQQKIMQYLNHSLSEEQRYSNVKSKHYNFDTLGFNQLVSQLGHYKTTHEFISKTEHFETKSTDAPLMNWADLVIVDEVGMISNTDLLKGLSSFDYQTKSRGEYAKFEKEMHHQNIDLETQYAKYPAEYNTPILLLGDKGQLFPPLDNQGNQYINPKQPLPNNANSELSTNHRQVGGNGFKLAELSKAVRNNPYNLETLFSNRKKESNISFVNFNQNDNQLDTIKNSLLHADYALANQNEDVYRLNLFIRKIKFEQQNPTKQFNLTEFDRLKVGDVIRVNQTEKPGKNSLRADEVELDDTKFDYDTVGGIPINDDGDSPEDNSFYFRRLGFKNGQSFIVDKIYSFDEINNVFNKAQRKLLHYKDLYQQGMRLIDVTVTDLHLNTHEENDQHQIKRIWVSTKYMFNPRIKGTELKNQSSTKDLPDEINSFMQRLVKLPDKTRNQIMNFNHRTCLYVTFNYAMTVYKAQGTERNNVVYFAHNMSYSSKRLDYTAITRAKENLIIINSNNAFPYGGHKNFKQAMEYMDRIAMQKKVVTTPKFKK